MILPLYILTGGKSSRFGQDKAFYSLPDGLLWYQHVYQSMGIDQHNVVLVQPQEHPHPQLTERVIADTPPGIGPLGGMQAALQDRLNHTGAGWILLASCDLIHPSALWVTELMQARPEGCQAVVFKTDRFHPFPGLFHTAALPAIGSAIAAQRRSLQSLLNQIQTAVVPYLANEGPPQANTPDELMRLWDNP